MIKKKQYTFIDLFAGIGGFHQAMHSVGMKCVFASELDKNARISYEANYKNISPELFANDYKLFNYDITLQDPAEIPPFDVCCGGFPCQPFSIAGLRRGFEDTRGTLFFNIANIVKQKIEAGIPPKILFLENVKGLKNHMNGETLKTILATLSEFLILSCQTPLSFTFIYSFILFYFNNQFFMVLSLYNILKIMKVEQAR